MQALYYPAREKFLTGTFDWSSGGDSFGLAVLDGTYTFDPSHEFRDDLSGVLATASIANPVSAGGGAADADNVSVSGVGYGLIVRAIVIYRDVGSAATDDLIYYANTQTSGADIYRTSDGTNPINFVWSDGLARIFRV